jgi:16S rRNA (guanine966-N2)-methyltransferase
VSSPRVIAGRYGGRVLETPRGLGTRPTSARVREALFNILGDLTGLVVLDLYAGSGALALEALSRGAARAVLVEHERGALTSIRNNVDALSVADAAVIVPQRLPRAIANVIGHGPFDLVLCDPPWADIAAACAVLAALCAAASLTPLARVALEHSAKDPAPDVPGLVPRERRRWGDTAVSLFVPEPPLYSGVPHP